MIPTTVKDRLPDPIRKFGRDVRDTLNVVRRQRLARVHYPAVQHMRAVLREFKVDLIIDVGANAGQFGQFLRKKIGYTGDIVSFEPVPSTFERLKRASARDPRWRVVNAAAGDVEGELAIHITRDSLFNSFRRPADGNVFFELNEPVEEKLVKVYRLDAFLKDVGNKNIFLKADTQGFDLNVIRGASGIMSKIKGVQTELSFIPIYDNMPRYSDVVDELQAAGFSISNMFPVTMTNLQAIEFDCVLVRATPSGGELPELYESVLLNSQRS